MKIETKKLLFDVMSACESIGVFIAHQTFERYRQTEILSSAVERKFEIVGEALVRLRAADPVVFGRIHDAQRVIGTSLPWKAVRTCGGESQDFRR